MLRSIIGWSLSFSLLLALTGATSAADRNKAKPPEPTPAEIAAREHIQQALLAESLGDNALRAKHLAAAALVQPNLPETNWHLGRVQIADKWVPLAEAEALAAEDKVFREYRRQRDEVENPTMLLNLARWCAKNGFSDAAKLHFGGLLGNAASSQSMRNEAIKRLDLHRVGNTWMTSEDMVARETATRKIADAIAKWQPKLKQLQSLIDGDDFAVRDAALAELGEIDDPAIIPVLELLMNAGGSEFQAAAVKRLSAFKEYEATQALVVYAVLSNFSLARADAIEALRGRPPAEYVPQLLEGLVSPIKSQFQVTWDSAGRIRYQHAFSQQSATSDLLLITQGIAIPQVFRDTRVSSDAVVVPRSQTAASTTTRISGGTSPLEAFRGELDETKTRAVVGEANVQLANSTIAMANQRLFEALEGATKQQLQREPIQWWNWWIDYNEYHWPRTTQCLYQTMASYYTASQYNFTHTTGTVYPALGPRSCFLAGTPVRTQTGLVAIETIQPGDRVLAQDQDSGELTYKLVLRTTLRPPAEMLKIKAGTEEIVTTLGHPFWVNGQGWRMAKQLKEGDLLHSLGGAIRIDAVEPMPKQPAHNLVVADFNSYFVGNQGLLVHDNEYRKPTRSIVPGLAAAD